jgi:hypothetical protein
VRHLRLDGRKLPKDTLRGITPVRGTLPIERRLDRRLDRQVVTAWLLGDRLDAVMPSLCDVRVVKVQGPSLVLVGLEELHIRKETMYFPQAWWCRLVVPQAGGALETRSPARGRAPEVGGQGSGPLGRHRLLRQQCVGGDIARGQAIHAAQHGQRHDDGQGEGNAALDQGVGACHGGLLAAVRSCDGANSRQREDVRRACCDGLGGSTDELPVAWTNGMGYVRAAAVYLLWGGSTTSLGRARQRRSLE